MLLSWLTLNRWWCRKISVGDVVVMDNLSSHRVRDAREAIEGDGWNGGAEPHVKREFDLSLRAHHRLRRIEGT